MRVRSIRSKAALLTGLVLALLLILLCLVPHSYAKYRAQVKVSNKIEYTNQLVSGFSMTNGLETKGPSDSYQYPLIPGTTVKVSPTIQITEKTEIPSELFVEVCATGGLRFTVENENWTQLEGLTGLNEGLVYVYVGSLPESGEISVDATIFLPKTPSSGEQFVFYAYLLQQTEGGSPVDTFTAAISPSGAD